MLEVVIRVLLEFGEPDHFFGVNALAVNHSRNLPVGTAGIKANAAAVHMSTHRLSHFIGLRALLQGQAQNLQGCFIDLMEEGAVKMPRSVRGVVFLQPLSQIGAAAHGYPEAAGGPEQEFDIPLHIPVVGLSHFRGAVDAGVVDRDAALVPLNSDGDGLLGVLQVNFPPDTEGDEGGVQFGGVFHLVVNA